MNKDETLSEEVNAVDFRGDLQKLIDEAPRIPWGEVDAGVARTVEPLYIQWMDRLRTLARK